MEETIKSNLIGHQVPVFLKGRPTPNRNSPGKESQLNLLP
jgi:hypothetical protein